MIPREIPKKIRQIELRTNHIVIEFAVGARASARFTARTPAASTTNPALHSIRPLKRREHRAPIPTGLRPPAQGCEERATLGRRAMKSINRNAVATQPYSATALRICHNPVGVCNDLILFTQGSSCVATLGYMPESLCDSPMDAIMAAAFARVDSLFIVQPLSFSPA